MGPLEAGFVFPGADRTVICLKTPKPCTYAQKTWLVEDDAEIADVGRVLCSTVK